MTAIYGICAFSVMMLLLYALTGDGKVGGTFILWSFLNYRMLTRGADKTASGERNRPGETFTAAEPAGRDQ